MAILYVRHSAAINEYVRWHYWFAQCLRYRMECDQPLIEQDPAMVPIRLKQSNFISWSKYAVFQPECIRELGQLDQRVFWTRVCAPVLFAGPIKRPDGQTRLVVINGDIELDDNLRASILTPPTLLQRPPRPLATTGGLYSPRVMSEAMALSRIEKDAANSSRVVLHFRKFADTGAQPSVLLEILLEDDDSIRAALHRGKEVKYWVWSSSGRRAYNITYFQ